MSVSTCSQSGFGTRRVRTGVAENCCNCSFGILRNACMRRVKTCVAEDCCESSSVILRNLCCVSRKELLISLERTWLRLGVT